MSPAGGRIRYLDGLRGVAILWVVVWHYTATVYSASFPYGAAYSAIPVLAHGWAGVNLFFLISGYVILLTLDRCAGFGEFIARRWLRLFPAMLVCSLIIFAASQVIGSNMTHGRANLVDLLPGLTFISPPFWEAALGQPVSELDGVFWTLYVEVGFYVTFGLLYFWIGWRRGLVALTAIWLSVVSASRLAAVFEIEGATPWIEPLQWLGMEYFGWFVSGALFLRAGEEGSRLLLGLALLAGLVSALTSGLWQPDDWLSCAYLAGCVLLFAAAQRAAFVRRILETRLLLLCGFVSYPLYLLHNELGVGIIATVGSSIAPTLWPLIPLAMIALMLVLALIMARFVEPFLAGLLRPLLLGRGRPDASLVLDGGGVAAPLPVQPNDPESATTDGKNHLSRKRS